VAYITSVAIRFYSIREVGSLLDQERESQISTTVAGLEAGIILDNLAFK